MLQNQKRTMSSITVNQIDNESKWAVVANLRLLLSRAYEFSKNVNEIFRQN